MLFLLRLAFLTGVGRYDELWQQIPPSVIYVLSRRPSFYDGGTNGTDYALYQWEKGADGYPVGEPHQCLTRHLLHERG